MIISARVTFSGLLPEAAQERFKVLGKRVRLINSNLWEFEFEFEFRTQQSIDQPFAGNEDYSWVAPEFTLADATSLVFRTVSDTLAEFHVEGELRMVSAEDKPQDKPQVRVQYVKRED
jgi:hypothetical protein